MKVLLMRHEYVEMREGGYYLTGSRVSLASIIYEYRDGATAETIRQNFPTLSLEHVHGAIAFWRSSSESRRAQASVSEVDVRIRGGAFGLIFAWRESAPRPAWRAKCSQPATASSQDDTR